MRDQRALWDLYQTAKAFNVRPSDLLDCADPLAAFCLDRACHDWGAAIESEIDKIEAKNRKESEVKVKRILSKWLGVAQQYRDPAKSGHVQLPRKGEG